MERAANLIDNQYTIMDENGVILGCHITRNPLQSVHKLLLGYEENPDHFYFYDYSFNEFNEFKADADIFAYLNVLVFLGWPDDDKECPCENLELKECFIITEVEEWNLAEEEE